MKLNLTQFWDEIQSKSIKKWYKNKNAVTGSNQWKFDNKIVKIEWNISLISRNNFEWNLIIKSWKFNENQSKSWSTPLLKLIENHWKLIINSLKINENLAKNWEKISYFSMKSWPNSNQIDNKIELFLNQIDLKLSSNSDQKWGGTTFWIMDLGWGVISWPPWSNSPRSCP